MLLTTGSNSSNIGKAISQDSPQALSHRDSTPEIMPTLCKVLINDTMQVMNRDSSKVRGGRSVREACAGSECSAKSVSLKTLGAPQLWISGGLERAAILRRLRR